MQIIRKCLIAIALVLTSLIFQQILTDNIQDITSAEGVIMAVISIMIVIILLITMILLKKRSHQGVDDEMIVVDNLSDHEHPFSIGNVVLRIILFILIFMGIDYYTMLNPDSFLGTVMIAIQFVLVFPVLLLYKTPVGAQITALFHKNSNQYDPNKQHYTKNESEHSDLHVFAEHDYERDLKACPYCHGRNIGKEKDLRTLQYTSKNMVRFILATAFDTDYTKKNANVCLDCKKRW